MEDPMNKLLHAPGARSISIHVLLEEIGKACRAEYADLRPAEPLLQ
jgi:hypothetical protein